MNFDINFSKLTVREGRELEKATGLSIGKLVAKLEKNDYSMDLLASVLLVFGRRENPDLTLDDIDNIDLSEFAPKPRETAKETPS